jgi:acetylglutamate kinase
VSARPRPLVVLKCGGAVAAGALEGVAATVAELGRDADVVVVHGAGPQISSEMERRGLTVTFLEGRRVTDAATLEVVRESLAAVNDACCAALGPRALGLSGDGIGVQAARLPSLGLVGDPVPCAPPAILDALRNGRVPVVTPLAAGPLNVNADDAAVALAIGLGADRVVFVTDVAGVLVDGVVSVSLDVAEAARLLAVGAFEGGIVPKLEAAVRAARAGIDVRIGATRIAA